MKIVHTSDWHLGQNFMSGDRKEEHKKFLDWLLDVIKREKADVLIIAGDVFDTGTPPNYALKLYYQFLTQVTRTNCSNVVVVGGNHDSVATLHAPKSLLNILNVHVVGGISKNWEEEIIVIRDRNNEPLGIVCAVPFLRDRDIRKSTAGESQEEKSQALTNGIKNHYLEIQKLALQKIESLNVKKRLPIVATGHLFAAGGVTSDGVREIHVGNLGQIGTDLFPKTFDYVALGHLHRPQTVAGDERIRYSGSPIPLSFSEAGSEKQILMVDLSETSPKITPIPVPEFRKIVLLRGNKEKLFQKIEALELPEDGENLWLEVQYTGTEYFDDLDQEIRKRVDEKPIELFAIKNRSPLRKEVLSINEESEFLDDLKVETVFERRLAMENMEEEQREELVHAFHEIMDQFVSGEENLS